MKKENLVEDFTDGRLLLILGVVAVVGISIGYIAFQGMNNTGQNYCSEVEKGISENKSFNGTVSCFEATDKDLNLSEKVRNTSELECACRIVQNGEVRIVPVARSN